MRIFYLIFILVMFLLLTSYNTPSSKELNNVEPTCAYPFGKPLTASIIPPRCTGGSPCYACTTCSGCKWCNDEGGSCGVCGGGKSSQYRSSGSRNSHAGNKRTNHSGFAAPDLPAARTVYLPVDATVSSIQLNVRNGPGTQYKILTQLTQGDSVKITEAADENWVKIETTVFVGTTIVTIEGYVYKKYLSF